MSRRRPVYDESTGLCELFVWVRADARRGSTVAP